VRSVRFTLSTEHPNLSESRIMAAGMDDLGAEHEVQQGCVLTLERRAELRERWRAPGVARSESIWERSDLSTSTSCSR
jgi:hypothetical protein